MSRRASGSSALILGLVAIAWGGYAAIHKAWLCDDAFISFRYAENLTHGLGLVYNAGERVEGYSNFLWTLWIAIGMRLGATPERWSVAWGVVFYVATLVLLLLDHLVNARDTSSRAAGGPAPPAAAALAPLACLLAATHHDWQQYATGGLETSLFTFLVTAGYLLAVRVRWGVRGLAGSGLAFALASLTRPDGVLFVPIVGLYALWARRPPLAGAAAFGGIFLAAWLPFVVWKIAYYGEFMTNTYYAKSAYLPWYEQGWRYVSLYFQRYWVLALALGHEKLAPVSYLLQRKVHFTIRHFAAVTLRLDDYLPPAVIAFDTIPGRIVHWDPALMAELGRRGARFPDVPAELDRYMAGLDQVTNEEALDVYRRLKDFYFDPVRDSVREEVFRRRIARIGGARP